MIVKGVLSSLGSGFTNGLSGFTAYGSIGFSDGTDLLIDQSTRIAVPSYLSDKLSSALGQEVEVSLTENKRIVAALRINGRVYKIDEVQKWMMIIASSGITRLFVTMGLGTIVFPPLFIVYLLVASTVKNQIATAARAFD